MMLIPLVLAVLQVAGGITPATRVDTSRPPIPASRRLGEVTDTVLVASPPGDTITIAYRNVFAIRFDDTTSGETIRRFLHDLRGEIIAGSLNAGEYIIRFPDPGTPYDSVESLQRRIMAIHGVDYAVPTLRRTGSALQTRPAIPQNVEPPDDAGFILKYPRNEVYRRLGSVSFLRTASDSMVLAFFAHFKARIVGGIPDVNMYYIQWPDPGPSEADLKRQLTRMRAFPGVEMLAGLSRTLPPGPVDDGSYSRGITLTYLCGNTFRVRNATRAPVTLDWEAPGSAETGKLLLGPRPAFPPFSEANITVAGNGPMRLTREGRQIAVAQNGQTGRCAFPGVTWHRIYALPLPDDSRLVIDPAGQLELFRTDLKLRFERGTSDSAKGDFFARYGMTLQGEELTGGFFVRTPDPGDDIDALEDLLLRIKADPVVANVAPILRGDMTLGGFAHKNDVSMPVPPADTTHPPIPTTGSFNFPRDTMLTVMVPGDSVTMYYRHIFRVRFDDSTSGPVIRAFFSEYHGEIIGGMPNTGAYVVRFPDPGPTYQDFQRLSNQLNDSPGVSYAAPAARRSGFSIDGR